MLFPTLDVSLWPTALSASLRSASLPRGETGKGPSLCRFAPRLSRGKRRNGAHRVFCYIRDMRIGLIAQLHGRPGGDLNPSWRSVEALATTAEQVGFDMFVFEDVLMYRSEDHTDGCWESMTIAGAIAASTDRIGFGQSVVNSPYRSPAMTASMAETLANISGGRYVLGIGAGNSPQSDYEGFGFPTDKRYSRFAEAIEIIHTLLRTGSIDYEGEFYTARGAEVVLRGPSPTGPSVNIAGAGDRMLRLVARYADAWNWWSWDETLDEFMARLGPIVTELERACDEMGRDPSTLERTIDLYSVTPPGMATDASMKQPVTGTADEIASYILALDELGVDEVRCDLTDKSPEAVEAMAPVVEAVHAALT
jgi:alkanesulfonate monooxygenase SsuD/methylene tetrahydromethanopterin reductase-like flavin-dependent oxidoreductase (luciferase family)